MRQWELPVVPPLRVVIADDHPFFRQGLARLLGKFEIEVVAEASNGWGAIKAVEETTPDVVVLDFNMPVLSGVDVIRRLMERSPGSRVLVLSVSADEVDVTDAILAGAGGYVLKDGPIEDVVAGVRALAEGEALVSPQVAAMLLQRIRERERARTARPGASLSADDLEVLRLVAARRTRREIGEALGIDPESVGARVAGVLGRLQADAQAQAAARAGRNGNH
jgi:DNA-binding NarL/FixJ family response regulator